jgi:hypothetical protein
LGAIAGGGSTSGCDRCPLSSIRWTSPIFADARAAWDITDADGVTYHAEAAALRNRPVWLRLAHDQQRIAEVVRQPYGFEWSVMDFFSIAVGH